MKFQFKLFDLGEIDNNIPPEEVVLEAEYVDSSVDYFMDKYDFDSYDVLDWSDSEDYLYIGLYRDNEKDYAEYEVFELTN